jgi:hypothetical protein
MGVEVATIDQTATARDRARVVVDLETAAREANRKAGEKNTEVTAKQREQIDRMADAYAKVRAQVEAMHGPLATYARESANLGEQLQHSAVSGLRGMEDALVDVIMGTKSASEAFKSMANAIIADLARILIRKAITGPIAGAIGSLFGGSAGEPLNILPKFASGTDFAPGGMALVGEKGPEIVNLPRGSRVIPNDVARQMGGGASVTFAPVIDARGADVAAVARLEQVVARQQQEFAARVTDIVRRGPSKRMF